MVPSRGAGGLKDLDAGEIERRWRTQDDAERPSDPEVLAAWATRLVQTGSVLAAYDVARVGMALAPRHVRLRELAALALARSGAPSRALPLLEALSAQGEQGPETLGLLARVLKDLGLAEADPARRRELLARSRDAYLACHRSHGGETWTGINAATLSRLLGQEDEARALAETVRAACASALEGDAGGDPYWLRATLAEAELLLGRTERAASLYAEAVRHARGREGDVSSTKRNVRLLASVLPEAASLVERCFPLPPVLVFVGHMIDQPGRDAPRFPPASEAEVRALVAARLDGLEHAITYSSAACGGDILFLEEAQRRGFETHVVLPYNRKEFAADSVEIVPSSDWGRRYAAVLAAASTVSEVSPRRVRWGSVAYEFATRVVLGLARAHARRLDTRSEGLALWDGLAGDGPGGTAWTIDLWRERQQPFTVLDLPRAGRGTPLLATPRAAKPRSTFFDTRIRAVLFSDVKGFSRLDEWQVPVFVEEVLGAVAGLVRTRPYAPEISNTWGDALYMVFASAHDAGCFALDLVDAFDALKVRLEGFPPEFGVRVALHAGPLYAFRDPVTGEPTYGGNHVSYAARIEPIAPPGQVYASQWFAALCELDGVREVACDYVGATDFAKGYGRFPLYHVRRAVAPARGRAGG